MYIEKSSFLSRSSIKSHGRSVLITEDMGRAKMAQKCERGVQPHGSRSAASHSGTERETIISLFLIQFGAKSWASAEFFDARPQTGLSAVQQKPGNYLFYLYTKKTNEISVVFAFRAAAAAAESAKIYRRPPLGPRLLILSLRAASWNITWQATLLANLHQFFTEKKRHAQLLCCLSLFLAFFIPLFLSWTPQLNNWAFRGQ